MTNESAIHIRNLKFLLTEINKFLNCLSLPVMNKVFQTNDSPDDLRNPSALASKHKSTIKYGIDTMAFKDSQICQKKKKETQHHLAFSN